jgi:catechol 2,3-dioxygenase-like lactoylglutathione lyase family enzyme
MRRTSYLPRMTNKQPIFASDLPASAHWYTDVLGHPGTPTPDGLRFDLVNGYSLLLSARGQPAKVVLPVPEAAAYQQRFEQRVTVNGENQGRILETQSDSVTLVDPAGNHLQFITSLSAGPPDC